MPTIAIPIADEPFEARRFRCFTAEKLTDTFDERPFLHVQQLTRTVGPAIDECQLQYLFGHFATREADDFGNPTKFKPAAGVLNYDPLELHRHYVRVELIENDAAAPGEVTVLWNWYGIIEVEDLERARDPNTPTVDTGAQTFVAYGLLRELETEPVLTAQVQNADGLLQEIGRALSFNQYFGDAFPERGNRTESQVSHGVAPFESNYIFSWAPTQNFEAQSGQRAEKWSASQAVEYMLQFHAPTDDAGGEPIVWQIDGTISAILDWYDITTGTRGRSVKQVLDELVNRRRLAGYYVEVDDSGAAPVVLLKAFSFAEAAIDVGDGKSIAANSDLIDLVAETSRLVSEYHLRRLATHQVDLVRVQGAFVTSTFTIPYSGQLALSAGWDAGPESDYIDAADDAVRTHDELRDVYARFIVADGWNMQVEDANAQAFFVVVRYSDIPDGIADADMNVVFGADGASEAGKWWFRGKRFLRYIELKTDDSNDYRRPFLLFEEPDFPDFWLFGESVSEGEIARPFNVGLAMLPETLGIRANVNRAAGQHLIALEDFTGDTDDEKLSLQSAEALDFNKMELTGTAEWDERVRYEERVSPRAGTHDRIRLINVPDARLGFVVPGTTTDVGDTGERVRSTGEVAIDDRPRLENIAKAAAAWYGVERRPLVLTVQTLQPGVALGQLIEKLVIGLVEETVNTPITGLTYTVAGGTVATRIETSYADADFV